MFATLVLRMVLVFADPRAIDAAVTHEAVVEAAALWAPYQLVLERSACRTGGGAPELVVEFASAAMARSTTVLGTVAFGPDGTPEPRVTLFLDEVLRLMAGARLFGSEAWQWPRLLREQIVGRALGRILAHEIGHYVLSNRQHTQAGLMRSTQRSDELGAPSRAGFRLSAVEAARLRASRIAAELPAGTIERADTCGRP
jgi:hypothetical protein